MTDAFRIDRADAVAQVTLTRPEVRNALRPAEQHALAAALASLDSDEGVRLIVLTGTGTAAFSAGLNLKDRAAVLAELEGEGPSGLGAVLRVAQGIATPILGRVNGACVAGGMGLLAACSHAVAVDRAVFALPEVKVGLYPNVVMAGWAHRIAPGALDRMAETGDPIDAAQAQRMGLIDEIVADDDLDAAVRQAARRIMDGPPPAPRAIPGFDAALTAAEARTRAYHRSQIVDS